MKRAKYAAASASRSFPPRSFEKVCAPEKRALRSLGQHCSFLIASVVVSTLVIWACNSRSEQDRLVDRFREIDGELYAEYVQPLQNPELPAPLDCDPAEVESQPSCTALINLLESVNPALPKAADGLEQLQGDVPGDEQSIGPILDDMVAALRLMHEGNQALISGWRDADPEMWNEGLSKSQRAAVQAAGYTERLRQLAAGEE